jgi:hypothetical protein
MLDLIISTVGVKSISQFNQHSKSPEKIQKQLALQIIRTNEDSVYGKKHGFSAIKSLADFQKNVPINSYADLDPYIVNSLNGIPAQLTMETPTIFATTSGTTGKSKFIPVTKDSKKAKSKLTRLWVSSIHKDHPRIFNGQILSIVSPEVESYAPCGIPCGSESGQGYREVPAALKKHYSQPYEVFTIKDYEAKYYTLLRIAASQSVSFIYSCNPSTVLLMAQRLGVHTEYIIKDVRDGTLRSDLNIDPELRDLIEKSLKPSKKRAAQLEKAAKKNGGVLLPMHVWPDLQVIGCWKGGSVGAYLDKFNQYYPHDIPVRDMGWLASEVRGSVPLSDEGSDGPLAIETNFYEFFPADAAGKPEGTDLLTVDQLEQGKRYFVYVTTFAGLYRYDMNDILEVTGFHNNTPKVRFVQKGKGVISFTGEKLYEAQVIAAVEKALSKYKGNFEFITALGEMHDSTPRYTFLVEFNSSVSRDEAAAMLEAIEQEVRNQNMEYASKRDSHRLANPVLRIIKQGEFDRYRKRMVSGGKNDGQFKTLRITTDTSFTDEFETAFKIELERS